MDRENYFRLWSDIKTWGISGKIPIKGNSIEIPYNYNVIMDVNPPILKNVIIDGNLYFDYRKENQLEFAFLFIRKGKLFIGNSVTPMTKKSRLISHSLEISKEENIKIGNINVPKYSSILVTGELNVYGIQKRKKSYLKENLLPNGKILKFIDEFTFNLNEKIYVFNPTLDKRESINVYTVKKSTPGEIEIDRPVKNFHYGNPQNKILKHGDLDMRAMVLQIGSNSVEITANETEFLKNFTGLNIFVLNYFNGDSINNGQVKLSSCIISNLGKRHIFDLGLLFYQHKRFSKIDNTILTNMIEIENSEDVILRDNLIQNPNNYGINIINSKNILALRNIIYQVKIL